MGIRRPVEKSPARLQQTAHHLNGVIFEIVEQNLQTQETFRLGEDAEFGEFRHEADTANFGLESGGVLATDEPAELPANGLTKVPANVRHHGIQDGHDAAVERKEIGAGARDIVHGLDEFLSVVASI